MGNEDAEYRIILTLDNRSEETAHYGALIACHDELDYTSTVLRHAGSPPLSGQSACQSPNWQCQTCNKTFGGMTALQLHNNHVHNKSSEITERSDESDSSVGQECSSTGNSESVARSCNKRKSMSLRKRSLMPVVSDGLSDTSSNVRQLSCPVLSVKSFESSPSDSMPVRRSTRLSERGSSETEQNLCQEDEELFKKPSNKKLVEQQCQKCGRFFKNINRHKKCINSNLNSLSQTAVPLAVDEVIRLV
jgi:hypothetical protein